MLGVELALKKKSESETVLVGGLFFVSGVFCFV